MNNNLITILKTTMKVIIGIVVLLLLLFGSAGTIYWIEAWILIIIYFIYVMGSFIWLKKNNPELLKERTSRRNEGKWWDKIILTIYTILLMFMLVICGIDAVRFHWSNLPLILKIIGFIGYIPSVIIIFLTIKENAYLSEVVRIQKDRSQQVVKTGPYKYVRHPMYSGIILMILFTPFALGSFIALIFSGLIIILFIIRTYLEDKTLQNELPGYKEYIKKVRYRLVPGLW
jgi:protein-S-isoprenylcysteine O-methyltransferase Ste14